MTALGEQYDRFKKMGAEVVTVSTDAQLVHLAWHEHEKALAGVKYPMEADPTGQISRLFGVYDEGSGLALRGTFMVSPEGTLLNCEMNWYNLGCNIDEMMREGEPLSREENDRGLPVEVGARGEGDRTLTPSVRRVGHGGEALES